MNIYLDIDGVLLKDDQPINDFLNIYYESRIRTNW
jgi:hypothetical protein